MRVRLAVVLSFMLGVAGAYAADEPKKAFVELDLSTSPAATTTTYATTPGAVSLRLVWPVPGAAYQVEPSGERKTAPVVPATEDSCKGKIFDAIRKFMTDTPDLAKKPAPEKQVAMEAEKALTSCTEQQEEKIEALGEARKALAIPLDDRSFEADQRRSFTVSRVGGALTWRFVVAAEDPDDAAKAELIHPNLDALLETTRNQPSLIRIECSFGKMICQSDALYVNADSISSIYVTDIPRNLPFVAVVTAGEALNVKEAARDCGNELNFNAKRFAKSPPALLVGIHMRRGTLGIIGAPWEQTIDDAKKFYGIKNCGEDDPRERIILTTPTPAVLPFVLRGRSETILIDITAGDDRRILRIPVRYQRFWVEAGGFFAFSRVVDQEVERVAVANKPAEVEVRSIRRNSSIKPATGIVVNIHPGNKPIWALQFGIAASQDRLPSYYLGLATRLREVGKRGLLTLAGGIALQEGQEYPHLRTGTVAIDSPFLTPVRRYGIQPYVSLTFGFSFGGVSERAEVAASVTSAK